jgi:predicted kinase
MNTIYVMVGLPGSGKSTYLNFLNDPEYGGDGGFVYSTDNYIEGIAQSNGWTYNQVFKDFIKPATKHMDEQVNLVFKQGHDVFWDQTNMSIKKRASILSRVPKNYRKVCICRVPPRDAAEWKELDHRLLSREGKSIPHHIIESMADSYIEPSLEEGFDEVRLYDIYGKEL